MTLIQLNLSAAPHEGEEYDLKQPDGSYVNVRVWGDEYYQRVETPEGYTLIRNAESWISYAKMAADATRFVASDLEYTGTLDPVAVSLLNIPKSLRLPSWARNAQAEAVLRELEADEEGVSLIRCGKRAVTRDVIGDIKGLTILIDFSDEVATIEHSEINDFANKVGYDGYNNNGSVHDYFWDVSGQKLNYTNTVLNYRRAEKPKSYYDSGTGYAKARELMLEILNATEAAGFDFSTLTVDDNDRVLAVNVLYAGRAEAGWANGLWPHSGSVSGFSADGVDVRRYQMTSLGSSLSLGTFCHENGHMVCRYPDLYDYDGDSNGIGSYGLMASSGGRNPRKPCAPLRDYYTGWDTLTDISNAVAGTVYYHRANSNTSYIYINPDNEDEAFYIEARRKTGRSATLPDEGLAIWHWDRRGSNSDQEMTPDSHYRVSLEQADNQFDLEKDVNGGDRDDLFDMNYKDEFNDNSEPDALWWDGSESGMDIIKISEIGDTMSFTIGGPISIKNKYLSGQQVVLENNLGLVIYNNKRMPVSVEVFDIRGRRLIHSIFNAAMDVIRFDKVSSLANGTYFYYITAGLNVVKRKFVINR
jgi:M6 family metalloprotease-like protein